MPRKLNSRRASRVGRDWPCYEDQAEHRANDDTQSVYINGWTILSKELERNHALTRHVALIVTLLWFPILGVVLTLLALAGTAAPVMMAVGWGLGAPILAWLTTRPP